MSCWTLNLVVDTGNSRNDGRREAQRAHPHVAPEAEVVTLSAQVGCCKVDQNMVKLRSSVRASHPADPGLIWFSVFPRVFFNPIHCSYTSLPLDGMARNIFFLESWKPVVLHLQEGPDSGRTTDWKIGKRRERDVIARKNSQLPAGFEPETFWSVVQCDLVFSRIISKLLMLPRLVDGI